MGASSSKLEEDKALQLCHERKKFVRQALDGRCALATAHVFYVQSLKSTGTALRKFVEPEGPAESSLYTSTSATPEPFALTEKSLSHFSFSSPSGSQHVDVTETLSPSPSPPLPKSNMLQVNHMKFRGISSKKVEEKPPIPVTGVVASSSTPQATTPRSAENPESSPFEASPILPETPPWDYFGLFHPIDHQFSEEKGINERFENVDDITHTKKGEGIPDLEDGEDKSSFHDKEESQDSDDEFDEPSTDTLVRSFENFNRMHDHNGVTASHTMPLGGSVTSEKEFSNQEKSSSPILSPVRPTASAVSVHVDMSKMPVKEDSVENKIAPKDFLSSMKDIESLFIKASESGKEVPRMLEANKLHFRPIFPGKESGSAASIFFKACFACGEDHSQVQEDAEPAQSDVKYLTWHRTESSRSSSSRNPLGLNSDDIGELNNSLFDSIYMISGSHASTLDRLYAWERKLYDEVKASETVRRMYDAKCKFLRQLESKGESSYRIDKTRASVKDLHSRIIVAIHRINSISNRIEELRDQELQPQLEELIKGLSRMWEVMLECHRLQYGIISAAYRNNSIKAPVHSESHRQITIHLENELSSLSSSFTKWMGAQKSYLQAINTWLLKCVSLPQKFSKRKKRVTVPPWRNYGPPIYVTCGVWLDGLEKLPTRAVSDAIKGLAAETAHFLPRQEKNQGKGANQPYSNIETGSAANMLNNEASDEWNLGLDRFRSSLEGFLGQLNSFADSSVMMYAELEKAIEDAKNKYDKRKSQSEVRNA